MTGRIALWIIRFGLVLLFLITTAEAKTKVQFINNNLPRKYFFSSQLIIDSSDSLYINGKLLKRDDSYRINHQLGFIDLSQIELSDGDTLYITYSSLPGWLKRVYGEKIPEAGASSSIAFIDPLKVTDPGSESGFGRMKISGTKTFRVGSESAGGSNFGQSLDMNLSGMLNDKIELSGTISDRGFNPAYGTANSRIEELDKVNLKLTAPDFKSELGDIIWSGTTEERHQRVSGLSMMYRDEKFGVDATVARPKGRFETVRLTGEDGRQGPYRVTRNSSIRAVVPLSEEVWLDGKLLIRGANNDYIMDYPSGWITFNVNHPIDRQSRIEIDFEPVLADYKGEFYAAGSSVSLMDSMMTLKLGWVREGDNKNETLLGNLSQESRNILSGAGDNDQLTFQSGVSLDSSGSYVLIIGSLPDSIYQFVGEGLGDYKIVFGFVGSGQGDYRYVGYNRYDYVGAGKGDYQTQIRLRAPKRVDYYSSELTFTNEGMGRLNLKLNQTDYDKNLLSALDDNDNKGLFYEAEYYNVIKTDKTKQSLELSYQKKESTYKSRQRLLPTDIGWDFFLPNDFIPRSDEKLLRASTGLNPISSLTITPEYRRLDYINDFKSEYSGVRVAFKPYKKVKYEFNLKNVDSKFDSNQTVGERNYVSAKGEAGLYEKTKLIVGYETETRKNDYSGFLSELKLHKIMTSLSGSHETISYENYRQDSLAGLTNVTEKRDRVSVQSERKFGNLDYKAIITWQSLRGDNRNESSLLNRLNMNFADSKNKFYFRANYNNSRETRNSLGIAYVQVESGSGDYIFENGTYVPDEYGDYIRLDEILSDTSRVVKNERTFELKKSSKNFSFNIQSFILEELQDVNSRNLSWLIPFYFDNSEDYFYYNRRYSSNLRLIKLGYNYLINLKYDLSQELRTIINQGFEKSKSDYAVILRQPLNDYFFEESFKYFENKRDKYFTGGGGDISGYEISGGLTRRISKSEVKLSGVYRRAESVLDDLSNYRSIRLSARINVFRRGEIRSEGEFYSQDLTLNNMSSLYLLTDNKPGSKGAVWSLAFRYGIKDSMRINFSLTGRNADNRSARINFRSEFVTSF